MVQVLIVAALLLGLLLYHQMPGVAAQDAEQPGSDEGTKSAKRTADEIEQIREKVSTSGYWKKLKRREFGYVKEIYAGEISAHAERDIMHEHIARMNSLMAQWNPIQSSKEDLKKLVGEPTESGDKKMVYRFDTGLIGVQWTFTTRKKKVTGVQYQAMD